MKQFKFRLQKVLELEQHYEKMRQQELALLQNNLQAAELHVQQLTGEQDNYYNLRIETEIQGAPQLEISIIERYLHFLKQKILNQQVVIEQVKQAITKKQTELWEVTKKKKSLEKYKAKKQHEYEKMLLLLEQKFLDEIALRKYSPS